MFPSTSTDVAPAVNCGSCRAVIVGVAPRACRWIVKSLSLQTLAVRPLSPMVCSLIALRTVRMSDTVQNSSGCCRQSFRFAM
jgi:succinate dehydrogenase/fumarate reductase-like Fe-S protein